MGEILTNRYSQLFINKRDHKIPFKAKIFKAVRKIRVISIFMEGRYPPNITSGTLFSIWPPGPGIP